MRAATENLHFRWQAGLKPPLPKKVAFSRSIPNQPASALRFGHNEDLLRIRVLHFAPRRVTAHVNVAAVWIEGIKNEPGLARNRLCHRKL